MCVCVRARTCKICGVYWFLCNAVVSIRSLPILPWQYHHEFFGGEESWCFVTLYWPVVPLLILWRTFFKPPILLKVAICWCFSMIDHPITKHSLFLSVLWLNAPLYHCACFLWCCVFTENINDWVYITFILEALALLQNPMKTTWYFHCLASCTLLVLNFFKYPTLTQFSFFRCFRMGP